jgi:hypothetical protein
METMFDVDSKPKFHKLQEVETKENKNMGIIDEESDDDDDYQVPEANIEVLAVLDHSMRTLLMTS